eukprot:Nk52_evm10s2241 gene=Nk52_evmTU10s2241
MNKYALAIALVVILVPLFSYGSPVIKTTACQGCSPAVKIDFSKGKTDLDTYFDSLEYTGTVQNGERQRYQKENAYVNENNNLVLKTNMMSKAIDNSKYASGRVVSKFVFQYGKISVKAKIPTYDGAWPAIWTLAVNVFSNDRSFFPGADPGHTFNGDAPLQWPHGGENDIMEFSSKLQFLSSTQHFWKYPTKSCPAPSGYNNGQVGNIDCYSGQNMKVAGYPKPTDFHVYELNWLPDRMEYSVDGQAPHVVLTDPVMVSKSPAKLILNTAIGGNLGSNDVDEQAFQSSANFFEVDYVQYEPIDVHLPSDCQGYFDNAECKAKLSITTKVCSQPEMKSICSDKTAWYQKCNDTQKLTYFLNEYYQMKKVELGAGACGVWGAGTLYYPYYK